MGRHLESDLARTLQAAAEAAPAPEPDILTEVAARRRRRRRNRLTGLAAAVTVLVAAPGFGVAALRNLEPPQPSAAIPLPIGKLPAADLSTAAPIRDLWPEAVVKLPFPLPDGRRYSVYAPLGGDEYVVLPFSEGGAFQMPAVLNARSGAVRELAKDLPAGFRERRYGGIDVTENNIFWIEDRVSHSGTMRREVWGAPKVGGASGRRARLNIHSAVRVIEAGGDLYVGAQDPPHRVYRIAAGGEPQLVAEGFVLDKASASPWAHPAPVENFRGFSGEPVRTRTFRNVVTREDRAPRAFRGVTTLACSPVACLGHAGDSLVSYGFDGSRPLRAMGAGRDAKPYTSPSFDSSGRFVQIQAADSVGAYLWDRKTNTIGRQPDQGLEGDLIDLGESGRSKYIFDTHRIR